MSHSLMLKCQKKMVRIIGGKTSQNWIEVFASDLPSVMQPDIRCIHCHGMVRVHRKHVEHGPRDHVEHVSRQDAENCRGGHHFKGEHRMSLQTVQ